LPQFQVQNASRLFAEELFDEDGEESIWGWLCPCYKRYERLEMIDMPESPAPSPARVEIQGNDDEREGLNGV